MENKEYELTISPNYVNNWGVREAIRELLQNAVDGETCGYPKSINYDSNNNTLSIYNDGVTLAPESLILGGHSKEDRDDLIGGYHEGMKLALVVLLRKGFVVNIENGNKTWTPRFKISEKFNTQVLCIEEKDNDNSNDGLGFYIKGITQDVYNDLYNYFPCIDDDFGEIVDCETGSILLDERFKGKMFVEGLYIQTDDNFEYGYNFNSDVVELDRDRKAINYYELRALTAKSFATAESCHPKLFKAISSSVVDVRNIEDVIDEASEEFLMEYRNMFYEKKGLEENTLVATESVMKQLEQMDVDVPVVKGTEIESYLIAKANDKMGLIEKAKEEIQAKSNKESALDSFKTSNYRKVMEIFIKIKKYLPKRWQKEFLDVANSMKPYRFYDIADMIPDDFDYSIDSCNKLYYLLDNEKEDDAFDKE